MEWDHPQVSELTGSELTRVEYTVLSIEVIYTSMVLSKLQTYCSVIAFSHTLDT